MKRVRKSMRLNTRTLVLLTTIMVLLIGLLGCFPQPRPDTTPPVVNSVVVSPISPNTVQQGLPVTATVSVMATDDRSNLKHTEIKLFAKLASAPDTAYQPVEDGTAVVAFPAQRSATVQHQFTIPTNAAPFTVVGDFVFQARATAEDIRGNKSTEAVRSAAAGFVVTPGRDPQLPEIHELQVSLGTSGDEQVTVPADRPIRFSVRATDADGDLQELKLEIQTSTTESTEVTVTHQGAAELTAVIPALVFHLEGQTTSATFFATATAKDEFHPDPRTKQFFITVYRQGIMLVEETHLQVTSGPGDKPGLPQLNWGRYKGIPDEVPVIKTDPLYNEPASYILPFAITTLKFDINVSEVSPGLTVKLFIYTKDDDLFKEGPMYGQYLRGTGEVDQNNSVSIELANLSADNAKWLALKIEGVNDALFEPWFVWKIGAAGHSTAPEIILEELGLIEDLYEGQPIKVRVQLKDEILRSLDDFRFRFEPQGAFTAVENLIHQTNQSLPDSAWVAQSPQWQDSWRFAIRYHARIEFLEFDEENDEFRRIVLAPAIPDPKVVYAISRPHMGTDPNPNEFEARSIHQWYRFDGTTDRVNPTQGEMNRIQFPGEPLPVDYLYYFGAPDRQVVNLNDPRLITEFATLEVEIYPEIVVVDQRDPDVVLFVADASLGAANRSVHMVPGYKEYDLTFSARNTRIPASNMHYRTSASQEFPIYADNTSPTITVTHEAQESGGNPLQKVFADRRPHFLSGGYFDYVAVPMFFADSITVNPGQKVTIGAQDNLALYDLLVVHTSFTDAAQTHHNWRDNLPEIITPTQKANIPMGFDFIYRMICPDRLVPQLFYQGKRPNEDPHTEDVPTKSLADIFEYVNDKALFTDIYTQDFMIDPTYEHYSNYTWSNVWDARTDVVTAAKQDRYFFMDITEFEFEFQTPIVPGEYWVWIVARDRGAQDTYLFDYEDDMVNIDPKTGLPYVYQQNVRHHQNLIFQNEDYNLEDPFVFYENSESEADAPMVVLLRVNVVSQSLNIQRLDIHEPNLVSYPTHFPVGDFDGLPKWYAHSYNVHQPSGAKIDEFDIKHITQHFFRPEPKHLLPVDLYPVYKRLWDDKDLNNRFGFKPDGVTPQDGNLWNALETFGYRGGSDSLSYEAVPVIGGPDPTTLRVKTHEDIEKVTLEFVEGEFWTVREYAAQKPLNILDTITIPKDYSDAARYEDGRGKGGYWAWELDWEALDLMSVEATYTLVIKAQKGHFWEQWQWPLFVDTKGPRIILYNVDAEYYDCCDTPDCEVANNTESHLNILDIIPEGRDRTTAYEVRPWIAMLIKDEGGIFFENRKGWRDYQYTNYNYPLNPLNILSWPNSWQYRMQIARREDMKAHDLFIRAGNTWYYSDYNGNNLSPAQRVQYSYLLGYPGFDVETPDATDLRNSLKYMLPSVQTVEFWNRNAVLGNRLMSYMDEIYSEGLDWDHSGRHPDPNYDRFGLPTRALFHNIDMEKFIWQHSPSGGDYKIALDVSVMDELGNPGEWSSFIRKLREVFRIVIDQMVKAGTSRQNRISATISSEDGETNIKLLEFQEQTPAILGSTPVKVSRPVSPPSRIFTGVVNDVLAPAWTPTRTIQVAAFSESDQPGTSMHTFEATYCGNKPDVKVEPLPGDIQGGKVINLVQRLQSLGKSALIPLLSANEIWAAEGYTGEEALVLHGLFTSDDDNVDQYHVQYIIDDNKGITSTVTNPNAKGEVKHIGQFTLNPAVHDHGSVDFTINAWDDPGSIQPDAEGEMKIWYQNPDPDVFVEYVGPRSGLTGTATEIIVVFQSDILFMTKAELLSGFSFYRHGILLDNLDVRGWNPTIADPAIGAPYPLTEPGRARGFIFHVSPYSPISSRLAGTMNGIEYIIRNLFSARGGLIDKLPGANRPPSLFELTAPEFGEPNVGVNPTLRWEASVDPDGDPVIYDIYLWEKGTSQKLLASNVTATHYTLTQAQSLILNKEYWWFVIARDFRGGITASELGSFSTKVVNGMRLIDLHPSVYIVRDDTFDTGNWAVAIILDKLELHHLALSSPPWTITVHGNLYWFDPNPLDANIWEVTILANGVTEHDILYSVFESGGVPPPPPPPPPPGYLLSDIGPEGDINQDGFVFRIDGGGPQDLWITVTIRKDRLKPEDLAWGAWQITIDGTNYLFNENPLIEPPNPPLLESQNIENTVGVEKVRNAIFSKP